MAVSRMRNGKYAIWPLLMAESPQFHNPIANRGQIPCSTERISCFIEAFMLATFVQPALGYHDVAVATSCYIRHRVSNGDSRVLFFSSLSSVKTTSLPHTPKDLFDQI